MNGLKWTWASCKILFANEKGNFVVIILIMYYWFQLFNYKQIRENAYPLKLSIVFRHWFFYYSKSSFDSSVRNTLRF